MITAAVEEVAVRGDLGGEATYALLARAFGRAARDVPAGLLDREDSRPQPIEDVFHWFLIDKLEVLPDELALCITDRHMAAIAERVAKHWLIDRARETEQGSHRHTLERVLRADDQFVQRNALPMWALKGAVDDWSGSESVLTSAANAVGGIRPGRRGNDTQRPALAPREDLNRLLRAVLSAATGFVHIEVLTAVVRRRVRAWTATTHSIEELTDPQQRGPALHVLDSHPAEQADRDADVAVAILGVLGPRERAALLHLDDSAALQAALGVGKSQASVLRAQVRARVDAIDTTDADLSSVLTLLRTMLTAEADRTAVGSVRPLFLQGLDDEGDAT